MNSRPVKMYRSHPEAASEWMEARRRILLYLSSMDLSPIEELNIALDALRRAESRQGEEGQASPVAESMREVRLLLNERGAGPDESLLPNSSTPPVRRGSMASTSQIPKGMAFLHDLRGEPMSSKT